MKIMIEIPEEFICDYEADRFEDCFQRFICDSKKEGTMAGNYERETAEMLIKAFKDAEEVKQGHWVPIDDYPHEEWECDKCGFVYYEDNAEPTFKHCPECGSKMDGKWREEYETN